MKHFLAFALCVLCAFGQAPSDEERSLMQALTDGQSSALDMTRAVEAHLARYPNTDRRADLEAALAKAAVENNDAARIAKYGEPLLKLAPDDVLLLDRVAYALIARNEKPAADRASRYARTLEELLQKIRIEPGLDAARRQQDQDRALSRALLYQTQARAIHGEFEEAARLAARAFAADPSEESAHAWAETLRSAGKVDDAIARLADAFVISDPRATDTARLNDRLLLGDWYKAAHRNEVGLGDAILKAYDRMTSLVETRRNKLRALEPNAAATSPIEFTLTGLDGKPFPLASLKGNIIVMDFWATWCGPCRMQHPMYGELKQRFPKSEGVVFLEVNADEERAVVEPFLDDQKWDKDVYFEDGLARTLSVRNIPSTMIFDRTGALVSRMDGFDPDTFVAQMTARIQGLLAR
jgi:thiol-disulfide isomerase/thioredoxin